MSENTMCHDRPEQADRQVSPSALQTKSFRDAAESELEPFRQLRHRCPHCRKSFANKTYARQHIAEWCQMRAANRGCKTCGCYIPPEPRQSEYGLVIDPGSSDFCNLNVDLSTGPKIGCPLWSAEWIDPEEAIQKAAADG